MSPRPPPKMKRPPPPPMPPVKPARLEINDDMSVDGIERLKPKIDHSKKGDFTLTDEERAEVFEVWSDENLKEKQKFIINEIKSLL